MKHDILVEQFLKFLIFSLMFFMYVHITYNFYFIIFILLFLFIISEHAGLVSGLFAPLAPPATYNPPAPPPSSVSYGQPLTDKGIKTKNIIPKKCFAHETFRVHW